MDDDRAARSWVLDQPLADGAPQASTQRWSTRGGRAENASEGFDECHVWRGKPEQLQLAARDAFQEAGLPILPWMWITSTCSTSSCIFVGHLQSFSPRRILYPSGVCIYCGRIAGTKDHLLPRGWSGETTRKWVATVPACGECNVSISDLPEFSVSRRREAAHERIRKRYAKYLRQHEFTAQEMRTMGHVLSSSIKRGELIKQQTLQRLEWPTDSTYDIRAFHHTGILDPTELGLL